MKNINFIYSVDIYSVERIMYFLHATELCFLTPSPANKIELFVHSSTRNVPYVHPRFDSFLQFRRIFQID